MDKENKELQNSPTEAELEEKVRQDVSEKIRDAAAELEEEIADAAELAEETAEETDAVEEMAEESFGEDAEEAQEPIIVGYDEEGNPIFAEAEGLEEEIIPEPKWISVKVRNLILSLVGAAVVGAILLLAGMQIPGWVEDIPEGKTVATVDGTEVTDQELEYFIYQKAQEYIKESGGLVSDPAEFDWSTEAEEGKTAEDIVKERALNAAIENILLVDAGKKAGVPWNEKMEKMYFDGQMYQLEKMYGEELVVANALAQGYSSLKQYKQLSVRNSYGESVAQDMAKNHDAYYPDDETLSAYASTEGATVKHILIALEEATGEEEAPAEGEEAPVDKKILAEEILKKAQEGEDFDALVKEFGEDPGQPEEGYTFMPGSMMPEFEEAAFALGLNEISGIVETSYGYHIIKRIPGEMDLFSYWRADARVKTKQKRIEKISVADVVARVTANGENFTTLFQEYQENNPSAGY